MTRINTLDPYLLTDQHLMAEYRELPRIFGLAKRNYDSGKPLPIIDSYRMGKGHVLFFYGKLKYLKDRHRAIVQELKNRKYAIANETDLMEIPGYMNDWVPNNIEHRISLDRLRFKLETMKAKNVTFYKHYGKSVSESFYDSCRIGLVKLKDVKL